MISDFLARLGAFFINLLALAQGGFNDVNQIIGLLIALIAAILMPAWRSLPAAAAGATVAHILFGVAHPVLDGAAVVLPPLLTVSFWTAALALFLGYAVVIAVFFGIKSLFRLGVPGRRRRAAH